jgi:uncharacterized membrane protein
VGGEAHGYRLLYRAAQLTDDVLRALWVNENHAPRHDEDDIADLLGEQPIPVASIQVGVGRDLEPVGRAALGEVGDTIHREPLLTLSAPASCPGSCPPCRLRGRLGAGRWAPVALAALWSGVTPRINDDPGLVRHRHVSATTNHMLRTQICYALIVLGLLAAALIAGFFYAYSVSVMPGLGATDPLAATLAMRGINAVIRTPLFAFSFFGALAFPFPAALLARRRAVAILAIGGGLVYEVGGVAVTFTVNVPLNEALAAASPTAASPADLWRQYAAPWTAWNHVRTLASIIAFALVTAALVVERRR